MPGKGTILDEKSMRIISHSAEDTLDFGRQLGLQLSPGQVVLLTGPIGAGKSVLAHGIAEALCTDQWRGSPTFTIVNEYVGTVPIYHIDLYRLTSQEVEELGL